MQTWSSKMSFSSRISMAKLTLDIFTDIGMLLMVQKGIRGGICHSIYQYAKLTTNTWNIKIDTKNRHIFNIVM